MRFAQRFLSRTVIALSQAVVRGAFQTLELVYHHHRPLPVTARRTWFMPPMIVRSVDGHVYLEKQLSKSLISDVAAKRAYPQTVERARGMWRHECS